MILPKVRDPRPRQAIERIRAWAQGEIRMSESRAAGGHAMAAAHELGAAACSNVDDTSDLHGVVFDPATGKESQRLSAFKQLGVMPWPS